MILEPGISFKGDPDSAKALVSIARRFFYAICNEPGMKIIKTTARRLVLPGAVIMATVLTNAYGDQYGFVQIQSASAATLPMYFPYMVNIATMDSQRILLGDKRPQQYVSTMQMLQNPHLAEPIEIYYDLADDIALGLATTLVGEPRVNYSFNLYRDDGDKFVAFQGHETPNQFNNQSSPSVRDRYSRHAAFYCNGVERQTDYDFIYDVRAVNNLLYVLCGKFNNFSISTVVALLIYANVNDPAPITVFSVTTKSQTSNDTYFVEVDHHGEIYTSPALGPGDPFFNNDSSYHQAVHALLSPDGGKVSILTYAKYYSLQGGVPKERVEVNDIVISLINRPGGIYIDNGSLNAGDITTVNFETTYGLSYLALTEKNGVVVNVFQDEGIGYRAEDSIVTSTPAVTNGPTTSWFDAYVAGGYPPPDVEPEPNITSLPWEKTTYSITFKYRRTPYGNLKALYFYNNDGSRDFMEYFPSGTECKYDEVLSIDYYSNVPIDELLLLLVVGYASYSIPDCNGYCRPSDSPESIIANLQSIWSLLATPHTVGSIQSQSSAGQFEFVLMMNGNILAKEGPVFDFTGLKDYYLYNYQLSNLRLDIRDPEPEGWHKAYSKAEYHLTRIESEFSGRYPHDAPNYHYLNHVDYLHDGYCNYTYSGDRKVSIIQGAEFTLTQTLNGIGYNYTNKYGLKKTSAKFDLHFTVNGRQKTKASVDETISTEVGSGVKRSLLASENFDDDGPGSVVNKSVVTYNSLLNGFPGISGNRLPVIKDSIYLMAHSVDYDNMVPPTYSQAYAEQRLWLADADGNTLADILTLPRENGGSYSFSSYDPNNRIFLNLGIAGTP